MFNADIAWYTGVQDERVRNTDKPTFLKVVVHEFGHSVGLNHFDTGLAVMSQGYDGHLWWGGSETYRHHPMADDIAGSRALYSHSNSETDVTAMNFEMSGATSTVLWRSNNMNTLVNAGSMVNVEYTVANIGNVGSDFSLGIYLFIKRTTLFLPETPIWAGFLTIFLPTLFGSATRRSLLPAM